jgi:hypothetical protein
MTFIHTITFAKIIDILLKMHGFLIVIYFHIFSRGGYGECDENIYSTK